MKKTKDELINQERSTYNRKSGEKTLLFVGILIAIVAALSIVTLVLL